MRGRLLEMSVNTTKTRVSSLNEVRGRKSVAAIPHAQNAAPRAAKVISTKQLEAVTDLT
jgi:hypothetical protein